MNPEHIKISSQELSNNKRNLLESQFSLLNSIKLLREYKKYRKTELDLKVQLKTKIDETLSEIIILEKILPKSSFDDESKEKNKIDKEIISHTKKDLSLEEELDQIKRKLLMLNN
jgi:hypothetical protein